MFGLGDEHAVIGQGPSFPLEFICCYVGAELPFLLLRFAITLLLKYSRSRLCLIHCWVGWCVYLAESVFNEGLCRWQFLHKGHHDRGSKPLTPLGDLARRLLELPMSLFILLDCWLIVKYHARLRSRTPPGRVHGLIISANSCSFDRHCGVDYRLALVSKMSSSSLPARRRWWCRYSYCYSFPSSATFARYVHCPTRMVEMIVM